jgi:hypothetical protein
VERQVDSREGQHAEARTNERAGPQLSGKQAPDRHIAQGEAAHDDRFRLRSNRVCQVIDPRHEEGDSDPALEDLLEAGDDEEGDPVPAC